MLKEIKCPFLFRSGKKFHCSIKRGFLKRKRVCARECRDCYNREIMDAIQN